MIKQQIYIFFYFLLTFVTIACQESNNVSDTGWINGLKAYLEFPMEGGSEYCSFSLQNGLDASLLECYVPAKDAGWCEASVEGGKLIIRAFRSYTDSERHTSVTVEYERRWQDLVRMIFLLKLCLLPPIQRIIITKWIRAMMMILILIFVQKEEQMLPKLFE